MTLAIRATKLYLPRQRAKEIRRERLVEHLDEGLERELTLVAAPAGFGKTTLVAQWLADYPGVVAWLSLDVGDNDPSRFLTYLIAALEAASPASAEAARGMLRSSQAPPVEAVLAALLNEIAGRRTPTVLVLDDYHAIDSVAVDDMLSYLLQHLPHELHLVIVTREDPRLPLARLRARGQLTELRAADLRFTTEETGRFLDEVMGVALSEEAISRLEARTEGWIAGVQLAALSLRGREDAGAFIDTFTGSNRIVLDYLVEEVLQSQPAQIRDFLLRTCILERLTGPLCDAVTGQEGGSAMLARLERGNFFVVPLDDERRWYRYHRLFADVLNVHAAAELGGARPDLHLRASRWYESQDLLVEAVGHALAARAFERAAGLIESALPRLRRARQGKTLLAWREALPAAVVRPRPVLSAAFAGALLNEGRLGEAELHLQDAERWEATAAGQEGRAAAVGLAVEDDEAFRHLPVSLAMYRAGLAQVAGDAQAAARHARRALELAAEDDHEGRGSALALLGLAAWDEGDLEAAHERFAEGMARLRRAGFVADAVSGMGVLADIGLAQGGLREALATTTEALRLAEEGGEVGLAGRAELLVILSELRLERNESSEAVRSLERSRELALRSGRADVGHRWLVAAARVAIARGDAAGALPLLDEAERRYARGFFPDVRPIGALRARAWLGLGRPFEALAWVRERGLGVDDELGYLREYEHITLARALLAVSAPGAAELLARLLQAADAGGRVGSQIEVLALLAQAHAAKGETPQAAELLERALSLAAPEGYARPFVEGGAPLMGLLREVAGRLGDASIRGFALGLFAKVDGVEGAAGAPSGLAAARPPMRLDALLEPLTARELEVLRLIAKGMSNRDIAQRLHRAVSTIKGHNQVIFEKLQVGSRTEAIARGRELGLL